MPLSDNTIIVLIAALLLAPLSLAGAVHIIIRARKKSFRKHKNDRWD